MANISSIIFVCFEQRVYFYELFNIQVQYLQVQIVLRQVSSSSPSELVGTF